MAENKKLKTIKFSGYIYLPPKDINREGMRDWMSKWGQGHIVIYDKNNNPKKVVNGTVPVMLLELYKEFHRRVLDEIPTDKQKKAL